MTSLGQTPYIVVIGSLNVDLVTYTKRVPEPGETLTSESFTTGFGGKGANQAVATARAASLSILNGQPATVRMIGAIGDDEFGPRLREAMAAEGVDVDGVRVEEDERTGVAVILVCSLYL